MSAIRSSLFYIYLVFISIVASALLVLTAPVVGRHYRFVFVRFLANLAKYLIHRSLISETNENENEILTVDHLHHSHEASLLQLHRFFPYS